jgi:acetylornithine deacetylase/succinyl-diaminopimelate desuccinylase-like protein
MQDVNTWVLENNDKGGVMPSEYFFTAAKEQKRALTERLNATIAQLASVVQQAGEAALPSYLSSLLQQAAYTVKIFDTLLCGRYVVTENVSTLLLISSCPPQQDAFVRWGVLASRLLTFAFYQKVLGHLPVNVIWLIDIDGRQNASSLLRELDISLQGCLYDLPAAVSFTQPTLALGTKGLLSVDLEVKTSSPTQSATNGAILPNAAWRLLWALNSLKNAQEEILLTGFYDDVTPMEDEEVEFLHTNPDDEQVLQQPQGENFLFDLHGFQRRYAYYLLPTCTITHMRSGFDTVEAQHMLPSSAQASLDIYLVPKQGPHDIYNKLRLHLDTHGFVDVKITLQASRNIQHTALHEPFTQLVLNTARRVYGEQVVILPLSPQPAPHDLSQFTVPTLHTQLGNLPHKGDERQARFLQEGMQFLVSVMEGMT